MIRDWRPTLRIARRATWKHPVRSLLIALMVALPAVVGTLVATTLATAYIDQAEEWQSQFGQAEAVVSVEPFETVSTNEGDFGEGWEDRPRRDVNTVDLESLLPSGTELSPTVERPLGEDGTVELSSGDFAVNSVWKVLAIDPTDPATQGIVTLTSGQWPQGPQEIALTASELRDLRAQVGDTVSLARHWWLSKGGEIDGPTTEARISGIIDVPTEYEPTGLIVQGLDGPVELGTQQPHQSRQYLATFPEGTDVEALDSALAKSGVRMTAREQGSGTSGSLLRSVVLQDPMTAVAVMIGTGLSMLIVVLLAGTGVAIAARRMRRDIALLQVAGGSPRQVAAVVLAQGLVLGLLGAVIGVALGYLAFLLLRSTLATLLMQRLDGAIAGYQYVALAAILAVIGGLLAAALPALRQSRLSPAAALRNVTGASLSAPKIPWIALCAIAGGVLVGTGSLYLGRLAEFSPDTANLAGICAMVCFVVAVLGCVAAVPQVLAWVGRWASNAPMTLRLAARDAARSRHRTAPAAAAILAATVLGIPALMAVSSLNEIQRANWLPDAPQNIVTIQGETAEGTDAMAKRVAQITPPIVSYPMHTEYLIEVLQGCTPSAKIRKDCGDSLGSGMRVASPRLVTLLATSPEKVTEVAANPIANPAIAEHLAAGGVIQLVNPQDPDVGEVWWSNNYESDAREVSLVVTTGQPLRGKSPIKGVKVPVMRVVAGSASMIPSYNYILSEETQQRLYAQAGRGPDTKGAQNEPTLVTVTDRNLTPEELESLNGGTTIVSGWEPYQSRLPWLYAVVLIIVIGVALIATVIAMALSTAEQRRDLDTLAALGAPPRQRRRVTAAQGLLIGSIGVGIGLLFGLIAGWSAVAAATAWVFTIPWQPMLGLVIGVPLSAGLIGWLSGGRESTDLAPR